ncbi:hypothetical protein L1277_003095 [Okibacterium sp. HSC-33S16]|uniref:hypothetical protein n=1 Tax=Okibacterium sp. HSC-33S16 TaxID=2910965 RepID=UPI0020A1DC13|nr:hypothetical protein [Okibacterium sp. HSC-33S16]MCP2032982.1 hypothetical protein [Okibacterium sp. HSC-33S16]
MIPLGVALLAVGLTVSVGSGILETQAAGRQRISLWPNRRGYRRPRSTAITGWVAGLLVGVGAVIFIVVWGPAALYLAGFVVLPRLLVVAIHNRDVRVRQIARGPLNSGAPGRTTSHTRPEAADSPNT